MGWHSVRCGPTLDLVYCPDSIRFGPSESINSSSIADFLSLTLGYSLPQSLNWRPFKAITNVFSLPKASITVRINGHNIIKSINKFPILENKQYDNEFEILSKRTKQRFEENNRIVLKIDSPKEDLNINEINEKLLMKFVTLSAEQRFSEGIKRNNLKRFMSNEKVDKNDQNIKELVLEIETIHQILEALKKVKKSNENLWPIRGVFWFEIRSIGEILENHNYDQSVKNDAQNLVSDLIEEMTQELRTLYSNKVIITAIEGSSLSPNLIRNTRQTKEESAEPPKTDLNLAHNYYKDFHTAFATIGFTTLLIALSVFAISVSMWNIDPGKDSIIYRMTAQRIKKEQ